MCVRECGYIFFEKVYVSVCDCVGVFSSVIVGVYMYFECVLVCGIE